MSYISDHYSTSFSQPIYNEGKQMFHAPFRRSLSQQNSTTSSRKSHTYGENGLRRRSLRVEPLEERQLLSATLYVDANFVGGTQSGADWANAYSDIQPALAQAVVLNADADPLNDIDQIWIADGVYTPTSGSNRTASFYMESGVSLYGGFEGVSASVVEDALDDRVRDENNRLTYETTLSGDIGTEDVTGDNSYRIIQAHNVNNVTIDGLKITGAVNSTENGGGLFSNMSDLTLRALTIEGNEALHGAGLYVDDTTLTLIDSRIYANHALSTGGGMRTDSTCDATVINTLFVSNEADDGGAVFAGGNGDSLVRFINSTIVNNDTVLYSGGVSVAYGTVTLRNSILWNNSGTQASTRGNNAYLVAGSDNLIDVDPQFLRDPSGGDYGDLRLQVGSSAIDTGDNDFLLPGITTDLDGFLRITDGDLDGTATIDIGAYESKPVFAINDVTVDESDGTLEFTVSLSSPLSVNVDVDVSFTDNETDASDFDHAIKTVTFLAGETEKIVSVPITDDSITELSETFTASLSLETETDLDSIFNTNTVIAAGFPNVQSVRIVDMDLDDNLDVLAMWQGGNGWWKGEGSADGTWAHHKIGLGGIQSGYTSGVDAGDFDNDGDIDVALALSEWNDVDWIRNTDGLATTWDNHVVLNTTFDRAQAVRAGDIDGDGDSDFIVSSPHWKDLTWWRNNGNGSFAAVGLGYSEDGGHRNVDLADLNGNGSLDIIDARHEAVSVHINVNGTFNGDSQTRYLQLGWGMGGSTYATSGDFNGDGNLDVIGAMGNGTIYWYENTDGSATDWENHFIANISAKWLASGDFDRDGDTDFASVSGSTISWWANSENGATWTEYVCATDLAGASSVATDDIDKDGDLDLVATGGTNGEVRVIENNLVLLHNIDDSDTGIGTILDNDTNDPPSVSLQNVTITTLPEDTDTSARIKVADIVITDDALGTNELSLTGDDAALFEIVGTELYLKAEASLDFETNLQLDVTVAVDDITVGTTPDDMASLTIDITDVAESDFGDAPQIYPTLLADDGAHHVAIGPTLGLQRDLELDGLPSVGANGDDLNGTPDDEDGLVNIPILAPGLQQTPLDVVASGPSFLNAWIDFNVNGIWESSEQVAVDSPLVAGSNQLMLDIPLSAVPGTTYARFRLTGYDTNGALLPTGLADDGEVEDYALSIENDFYITGDPANDDDVKIWPGTPGGTQHRVDVNGVSSFFDATMNANIYVDGLGGTNTLSVYGKSIAENAAFDETSVHVNESGVYDIFAQGFGNAYVYGGGGADTAQILGSAGNDNFYTNESYTYLRGNDGSFLNYLKDFNEISVDVSGDAGIDTAYMYDGANDDILIAGEAQATLDYSSNILPGVNITATGFDRVDAYGQNGGTDQATLNGSSGDDTFTGLTTYAYLTGNGGAYVNYVKGFDNVTADVSGTTGSDTAKLFDGAGDDDLQAGETQVVLDFDATGASDPNLTAVGFPDVSVYALNGGDDTALMTGSAGNDRFTGRETYGRMKGDDGAFINYAKGFDSVTADVSGTTGTDVAILYDGAGDDRLEANEATAAIDFNALPGVNDANVSATGFNQTYSYATSGGNDAALLIGSEGDDRLTVKKEYVLLRDSVGGLYHYTTGFDLVDSDVAETAGDDVAYFYDGTGNDDFTSTPITATIDYDALPGSPDIEATATGFDEVYAYAMSGGTDAADLTGSASIDRYHAFSDRSYMRPDDDSYLTYTKGFQSTTAHSIGSGDFAFLYDTDGNDVLNADSTSAAFTLNPTSGGQVVNTATAFDQVYSNASNGGLDKAYLTGTSGDDIFVGDADWGYLLRSVGPDDFFNSVRYFDEVYADPGDDVDGNDDLLDLNVTYLLDTDPDNGNVW
jgi:hypothetical protein